MDGTYRAADGIAFRAVADGGVLVDLRSGRYYGLNGTATFIWSCLVDPTEGRRLPDDYAAAFSVATDQAKREFDAVAADLVAQGFILKP
jgi:hypothetical protein